MITRQAHRHATLGAIVFGAAGACLSFARCGGVVASTTDAGQLDAGQVDSATNTGTISVTTRKRGGGLAEAVFSYEVDVSPGPCAPVTVGSCWRVDCPHPIVTPDGGWGDASSPTAGTLTFTGGAFGNGLALQSDPVVGYSYDSTTSLFKPGDVLKVSATGAEVPAFGAQSVVAPNFISSFQWNLPTNDGGLVVAESQDLHVAWTGGVPGATVFVEAYTSDGVPGAIYFSCSFDAVLGAATIPKSLLKGMSTLPNGSVDYGQTQSTAFSSANWAIHFNANTLEDFSATFVP